MTMQRVLAVDLLSPLADIGSQGLNDLCASQESKLAVLWNIGIFALNFGPVVIGPILDYVGPKLTALFGKLKCLTCSKSTFIEPHFLSFLHSSGICIS